MGCLLSCFSGESPHDADARYVSVDEKALAMGVPAGAVQFPALSPNWSKGPLAAKGATPVQDENQCAAQPSWRTLFSPPAYGQQGQGQQKANRSPFSPTDFFSPGLGLQPSEGFQSPSLGMGM